MQKLHRTDKGLTDSQKVLGTLLIFFVTFRMSCSYRVPVKCICAHNSLSPCIHENDKSFSAQWPAIQFYAGASLDLRFIESDLLLRKQNHLQFQTTYHSYAKIFLDAHPGHCTERIFSLQEGLFKVLLPLSIRGSSHVAQDKNMNLR